MGEWRKYIIEFAEDPTEIKLMKLKNGESGLPCMEFETVTPYTEPDLEQVRKEAYDKGFDAGRTLNTGKYEKGLNDAWEAAKKNYLPEDHGGLGYKTRMKVFDTDNIGWIFKNLSASEAIEKIRAYEEKKKEEQEIKVGDWIQNGGVIGVVTYIEQTTDGICYHVLGKDGHLWYLDDTVTKKYEGRVPKEIAGFLKKSGG